MKTSLLLTLLLAVPALGDHHGEGNQESAGLPAKSDIAALEEAGFTALFNGKDLTGWK